ncbi:hypothetical protein [Cohnella sp.]
MNIMDGMDAARYKSGNPEQKPKVMKKIKKDKDMPMVLRNLNNK